jgi:multiple sugar transport system permease protein
VASLRQPGLPPPRTVEWWPTSPSWQNYREIFHIIPLARYLINSTIVVSVAVPVTLLSASATGFGLSQLSDPFQRRMLTFTVLMLMIPGASVWLFRYQILGWLNLLDSLWALILPALAGGNALYVLLFHWTFCRVPSEVFEAARLDGAGPLTIWWQVARPLSYPTSAVVILLAYAAFWGDFVGPLLYIYRPELYTLPVGLQILKQIDATNWPLLMAAALLAIAPIAFLLVVVQHRYLDGLSLSTLIEEA